MTPQERALVQDLFDRLARLEGAPRDREAERAIDEGLRQAPNALYALVQTALVQEEALKAADARIRELEAGAEPRAQDRGFLDTMRDTLFGREEPHRGSVPSVPAQDRGGQSPWVPMQNRQMGGPQWGTPQPGAPGPYAGGYAQPAPEPSRGGSFLGTAAASAAGVIGGALLLNSIRSAFGNHSQGPFQGALDPYGGGRDSAPWGGSSGGELSRQAGLDDIGRSGGGFGSGEGRAAGAFDSRAGDRDASQDQYASAQDESYDDDSSSDDDFGDDDFGGGDDTSEA